MMVGCSALMLILPASVSVRLCGAHFIAIHNSDINVRPPTESETESVRSSSHKSLARRCRMSAVGSAVACR
jgi:hypothetical protein